MTDKQIRVDGVDVSGCDFLAKEDDYCSYSGEYRAYKGQCGCSDEEMCKDHPNCFYKKALKKLQRKEQELQEAIDTSIREFNRAEELKTLLKRKEQECEKLKQTLAEIKEITKWHTTNLDSEDVREDMKQILQKISEVENAK